VKITHHVPAAAIRYTESVTPAYQCQVDKATERAQREYERAERRLAQAESRRQRHMQTRARATAAGREREYARKLKVLDEVVELRREELLQVEAIMKAVPASAEHRGRKGFRPVPPPAGVV